MRVFNRSFGNYLSLISGVFLIIVLLFTRFNPVIIIIIVSITIFGIINVAKRNSTIFEIQETGISKIQGKKSVFIAWNEIKCWGRLVKIGSTIGPYDEKAYRFFIYTTFIFVNKTQTKPYYNFYHSDQQFIIKFNLNTYLKIKEMMNRIGKEEFDYKQQSTQLKL